MADKDLVAVGSSYPAIFGDASALTEVLSENVGPDGLTPADLDAVGIPPGGGTQWMLPSITGDQEMTPELRGILVYWTSARTYWQVGLDEGGGGNPPDCFSDDGVVGRGAYGSGSDDNPTGECVSCPMNAWGSADPNDGENRGKACRESRRLYLLRPGQVIPLIVALPVTSIPRVRKYFLGLASAGLPYYGVETALKLEQVKGQVFTWSVCVPSMVAELSAEEREAARQFSHGFQGNLVAARQSDGD